MPPSSVSPIVLAKRHLRRRARAQRTSLGADAGTILGQELSHHLIASDVFPPARVVAGFLPLPGEVDIRPALQALHRQGRAVVLPETPPPGQGDLLRFRRWSPGCVLHEGRFGTLVPHGEVLVPQILLVPLLAFDRSGGRLGFGGGFYDRFLSTLSEKTVIGCAYASQEVDAVPMEPHDCRLDLVATERGLLRCEKG